MWLKIQESISKKINNISNNYDLSRTWIHVDLDAFYASVEMREDPSLYELPLAIEERGMIITTNYEA